MTYWARNHCFERANAAATGFLDMGIERNREVQGYISKVTIAYHPLKYTFRNTTGRAAFNTLLSIHLLLRRCSLLRKCLELLLFRQHCCPLLLLLGFDSLNVSFGSNQFFCNEFNPSVDSSSCFFRILRYEDRTDQLKDLCTVF